MNRISKILGRLASLALSFATISCHDKQETAPAAELSGLVGLEELTQFRNDTRQLYNNRKFAELEVLADRIRSAKERFADGTWKIHQFYDCMDCQDDEPETMWKLHETIHQEWEGKYANSSTAQIAKAQFYVNYAWKARSSQYASKVTEEGWVLFRERLAQARTILDQSKTLKPACPIWWNSYQSVALGQDWDPAEYDALFREAVTFEPQFYHFDCARAYYLLPRWQGKAGEWEKAAAQEIALRGEVGFQIYAAVIARQARYHGNIFKETNASWKKASKGYDHLTALFPDSAALLNQYCRLAYLAGDRDQAKKLFVKIGDHKTGNTWRKNEFQRAKTWAMSAK
jgi:Domain of unknown function (DUF4034)